MKNITFRKVAFTTVIILTLALIGCRTAPVQNVSDAPVTTTGKATTTNVKKAILTAGASLGWQMKEVKPGHIVGTLFVRKHSAVVDIPYSTKSFSIIYKDSTGLKYDGSTIHNNYNGWIQNLNRAIQTRLLSI